MGIQSRGKGIGAGNGTGQERIRVRKFIPIQAMFLRLSQVIFRSFLASGIPGRFSEANPVTQIFLIWTSQVACMHFCPA